MDVGFGILRVLRTVVESRDSIQVILHRHFKRERQFEIYISERELICVVLISLDFVQIMTIFYRYLKAYRNFIETSKKFSKLYRISVEIQKTVQDFCRNIEN